MRSGDLRPALAHYEQALVIFQALGDKASEAAVLNNIGGVHQSRGAHKQALEYFQRALDLDRELDHRAGIARQLTNIGTLYVQQRRFKKAEPLLIQAVEELQALGSPQVKLAQAWLDRARAGRERAGRA